MFALYFYISLDFTCQLCHTPSLSASSVPKIFSALRWKSPAYTSNIPFPVRSEFSLTMRRQRGEVIILRLCLLDVVASQSISKIYFSRSRWSDMAASWTPLQVPVCPTVVAASQTSSWAPTFSPTAVLQAKSRVTVSPLLQVQLSRTSRPTFILFSLFTLNSFLSLRPVVSLSLSLSF